MGAWRTFPKYRWYPMWWFNTSRGAEWFGIYLWIGKDYAWLMDWNVMGMCFGFASVMWTIFLMLQAVALKNYVEWYHLIGQMLWLLGNYWWQWGELHDVCLPTETSVYPVHEEEARVILAAGLVWITIYYVILRPLRIFPKPSQIALDDYNDSGVDPPAHLSFMFRTGRQYENIHVYMWLGKDWAWNAASPITWWISAIPTLYISIDFIYRSSFLRHGIINHIHFIVLFTWVTANLIWAWGEIYMADYDDVLPLFPPEEYIEDAWLTCRWYSLWVLMISTCILVTMYAIWIPMSALDLVIEKDEPITIWEAAEHAEHAHGDGHGDSHGHGGHGDGHAHGHGDHGPDKGHDSKGHDKGHDSKGHGHDSKGHGHDSKSMSVSAH